jgi:hypothetical protein
MLSVGGGEEGIVSKRHLVRELFPLLKANLYHVQQLSDL